MGRLFVYGTLLPGQANHAVLAQCGRFVCDARTMPELTLWDLGPYPALTLGGKTAIVGEIWDVDAFDSLDGFEGPSYTRASVPIADGTTAEAYVLCPAPAELLQLAPARSGARPIAGGDWRKR